MGKNYSTLFVFQESIEKTNEPVVTTILEIEEAFNDTFEKEGLITFETQLIEQETPFEARIIFFSQCAIAFTNFELNLKEIVRRSGYIQSVGELIYMAKWEEINTQNISQVLKRFCIWEQKARKLIFYKSTDNEDIDNILSNLLIDDSRYHIGTESFQKAEMNISKTVEDYSLAHCLTEAKEPIFFIKDAGETDENSPLKNFYLGRNIVEYSICYISEFKKDNSIHYLDDLKECKPFWAGIYTTPHRLMNAMLNLARVTKNSVVVDPFSHTGTLAIEASQIGCNVKAFDLHEIQGAKDNYEFLCMGGLKILRTSRNILKNTKDTKLTKELQIILSDSICLNTQGLPEVNENKKIEDLLKEYGILKNFDNRLFFYLLRRYEMEKQRRANLIDNSGINFAKRHVKNMIIKKPLKHIKSNYYTFFGKQLKSFEEANKTNGFPVIFLSADKMNEHECQFTDSLYKTNRIGYINNSNEKPEFDLKDILKSEYDIKDNSIDAVVTDPPYGYGEGLDEKMIRAIYTALFEKSFRWLKPLGVLVFCTLDKVKTGRKKGLLFTEDIIKIANLVARNNNVYFNLNYFYPTQIQKTCLYYWKSKYALNRSVIVLKINK